MAPDDPPATATPPPALHLASARGRGTLAAAVAGSAMVFVDTTVVNIAVPRIAADLDTGTASLQWILSGYLLALASLILLGGALGDRFGRRRVFLVGVVAFAAASLSCALAPTSSVLIGTRVAQGVAGALLVPGSLALVQASFAAGERGRAVGAWSGLTGVSTAVGPLLGGVLVDIDWRLVFLVNLPLAALTVVLVRAAVPETRDPDAARHRLDVRGALTAAAALGAVTYGLIRSGEQGLSPTVVAVLMVGAALAATFVALERRSPAPLLPLGLFADRQFRGANLATLAVYSSLGGLFFLLTLALQVGLGYSPLQAGAATLPITLFLLVLSPWSGNLAERRGPRLPMTVGPLVAAAGILLLNRLDETSSYLGGVLPGVAVFGLGLGLTVAPLTATALGAVPDRHAGVASGVNNAVARAAQLLAVALLPALAGLGGADVEDPATVVDGLNAATWWAATLVAAGGAVSFAMVRRPLAAGSDGSDRADASGSGS